MHYFDQVIYIFKYWIAYYLEFLKDYVKEKRESKKGQRTVSNM